MLFKNSLRLKLIIGFLIGVLSIGIFSIYSINQIDNAKILLDEQADILKSSQAMALHTKDSFHVLNIYLFTENSTELESLRSGFTVSSYKANKHLLDIKEKNIYKEILEQLQTYAEANLKTLQDMIYIHDLKLAEVNETEKMNLEKKENLLLQDSKKNQDNVQL
ncbi:hypothetical protein JXC34_00865, partial [Candidatus Woesearchaeota archaeon]|nr:hypothetical protein [Candidatus Woesearchaeota archaeon]